MSKDGMNYQPEDRITRAVVKPGEFRFGTIGLDHGHIYGMTANLKNAGAECKWVYDPDPKKIEIFLKKNPEVRVARSEAEVLDDSEVQLINAAAVPADRAPLGMRAMDAGKDYFTDKAPFTSLEQLEAVRRKIVETNKKYFVCYSERLSNECAMYAGELIGQGVIGEVIQVIGLGPHRLAAPTRPDWFFKKDRYGGILTDIGSHQVEQFLSFTGAQDAKVTTATVRNVAHPDYPELEDYGEFNLRADNHASGHFRVDWFTPEGLRAWGDGRTFVLGTRGYLELRKFIDLGTEHGPNQIYLVTGDKEQRLDVNGKIGFPFFGEFVLDCLNRTEKAMTQEHALKAAEISLRAQVLAEKNA